MRLAALVVVAACGDEVSISITPVLELPSDAEADALPELTQIRIALEGTRLENVVEKGQDIVLADVPLSDDLVLRLDGFSEGQGLAVGRTCPFSLADGNRPSPRLYFSQILLTGLLEQQAQARLGGLSVTLADDTVLLVGGEDSSVIERYDPRTATLVEVAHQPFVGRIGAAIAIFEDGRPAIIGGRINGAPAADALLVSSSGVVETVLDNTGAVMRSNVSATSLSDGDILITGGRDASDLASNRITRMRTKNGVVTLELVNSAALAHARERHAVTPLGDAGASLLITGGNDGATLIKESELYRTNLDERIALESPKFDLEFPRTGHRTLLLPDETIAIIGGVDAAGNPVRDIELFSLIDGVVPVPPAQAQIPIGGPAIDFSLVTMPDGSTLMVGGREREGAAAQDVVTVILQDVATGNLLLSPRQGLSIPRANPQLSVLCDGTVLISGGTDQLDFVERYNPNFQPKL